MLKVKWVSLNMSFDFRIYLILFLQYMYLYKKVLISLKFVGKI